MSPAFGDEVHQKSLHDGIRLLRRGSSQCVHQQPAPPKSGSSHTRAFPDADELRWPLDPWVGLEGPGLGFRNT